MERRSRIGAARATGSRCLKDISPHRRSAADAYGSAAARRESPRQCEPTAAPSATCAPCLADGRRRRRQGRRRPRARHPAVRSLAKPTVYAGWTTARSCAIPVLWLVTVGRSETLARRKPRDRAQSRPIPEPCSDGRASHRTRQVVSGGPDFSLSRQVLGEEFSSQMRVSTTSAQ